MNNILIIIKKQIKDTLKNKTILIQFLMFPVMTIVMENLIGLEGMPEHFFAKLFAVMYLGMAPLLSATSVIAEEKEKNTLRVLMMADIKPWQYLTGIVIYIWTICMLGALVMSTCLGSSDRPFFLGVMAAGFLISIVAGACLGIFSKNQMTATSLAMPVMLLLSFAPMISKFNDTVKKFSSVIYTQQISLIFDKMSLEDLTGKGIFILCINAVICVALFFLAYRNKGLE